MKLTKITITGMHNIDRATFNLKDFTYLYGKNGVGKSTVLQAVQLALLGYIPGTNKTSQAIFTHANGDMMEVELELEDAGRTFAIRRTYQKSKSTIKYSLTTIPADWDIDSLFKDLELPIFDFNSFMNQSPNAIKDWFINFLPKSDIQISWSEWLHNKVVGLSDECCKTVSDKASKLSCDIDGVKEFNEYLKSLKSEKGGAIKSMEGTISNLVKFDDYVGPDDSEYLKSLIATIDDKLVKARTAERIKSENSRIINQLAQYDDLASEISEDLRYKEASETYLDTSNLIVDINQKLSDIHAQIREQEKELVLLDSNLTGICPYTNTTCAEAEKVVAEKKVAADNLRCAMGENREVVDQLTTQLKKYTEMMSEASATKKNLEMEYAVRDGLRCQIVDETDEVTEDVEFLTDQKDLYTEMLYKLTANLQYQKLHETLAKEKFSVERDLAGIKELITETDANHLQAELCDKPFNDLENDLTGWIRQMYSDNSISAHFILSSKSNSFDFGLDRDHEYISYKTLSSGEKCVYVFAMMLCLMKRSDLPVKLLIVDDSLDHLDDSNANLVFTSLNKVRDVQILLAGVKECKLDDKSFVTYI